MGSVGGCDLGGFVWWVNVGPLSSDDSNTTARGENNIFRVERMVGFLA
jgi:hypothetical protein